MASDKFTQIGQVYDSYDCGYFSGYVTSLWSKTGNPSAPMSQQEVYQARDRSMGKTIRDDVLLEQSPFPGMNDPKQMSVYLNFLGVTGYQLSDPDPNNKNAPTKNPNIIRTLLHKHLPPQVGRKALILCVYNRIKAHWVVVLARNAKMKSYFFYDPGREHAPYGLTVVEDTLVAALADAQVNFAVWHHNEMPVSGKPHTVVSGESLSMIAGNYWNGDVLLFPLIYDANQNQIGPDWNNLRVGLRLTIPDISNLSAIEKEEIRRRARNWR